MNGRALLSASLTLALLLVALVASESWHRRSSTTELYSDSQVEQEVQRLRNAIKELNEGKVLLKKNLPKVAIRLKHAAHKIESKASSMSSVNAVQFAHDAKMLGKVDVAKSVENDILNAKSLLNSFIKKTIVVQKPSVVKTERAKHVINVQDIVKKERRFMNSNHKSKSTKVHWNIPKRDRSHTTWKISAKDSDTPHWKDNTSERVKTDSDSSDDVWKPHAEKRRRKKPTSSKVEAIANSWFKDLNKSDKKILESSFQHQKKTDDQDLNSFFKKQEKSDSAEERALFKRERTKRERHELHLSSLQKKLRIGAKQQCNPLTKWSVSLC